MGLMSPLVLARLRAIEADTRRLIGVDYRSGDSPACFYRPLEIVQRAHPTIRPRILRMADMRRGF